MLSLGFDAKYRALEAPDGAPKLVNATYVPGPGLRNDEGSKDVRTSFKLRWLDRFSDRENT